jgi:hypothetical protein
MLLEEITGYRPTITQEKLDVIEHQCQPFIKAVGGIKNVIEMPLYRGIKSPDKLVKLHDGLFLGTMRSDRKPRSTGSDYHKYINNFFSEKFDTPYRNGVFVTGHSDQATFYGKVYQMIPVGEFKYCWSPSVSDLYHTLEPYFDNYNHWVDTEHGYEYQIPEKVKTSLAGILNSYKETGLKEAINTHHEVMIWCHNYLLVQ